MFFCTTDMRNYGQSSFRRCSLVVNLVNCQTFTPHLHNIHLKFIYNLAHYLILYSYTYIYTLGSKQLTIK